MDGWALTLLPPHHVEYASTCQTLGMNTGYFMSFTIFLALSSTEFCNKFIRSNSLLAGGQRGIRQGTGCGALVPQQACWSAWMSMDNVAHRPQRLGWSHDECLQTWCIIVATCGDGHANNNLIIQL